MLKELISRQVRRPPIVSIIIILVLIIMALFGPLIAPYTPIEGSLSERLLPPFWQDRGTIEHLLGTDTLGRDILSRIIHGSRVSLLVSLVAIFVGGGIGSILGFISGHYGGWIDSIIMRMADIALSIPVILLALILAVILGPGLISVIIVIAILLWARYARQVRGETLDLETKDFIALARIAGCSSSWIITKHLLPNTSNTLIVLATLQIGWVILFEASLSFLGVGIPPPEPAWGSMVADGRSLIGSAWWVSFFPGVAILLSILSFNLLGDWLRDVLDPKLRHV